jgi:hypothetical protein
MANCCVVCLFAVCIKINILAVCGTKVCCRSRGIVPHVLKFDTGWKWMVNFMTWLVWRRERTAVPIEHKAWCSLELAWMFWRRQKSRATAGVRTLDGPACSIVTVLDLIVSFLFNDAVIIWDCVVLNGRMRMSKEWGRHRRNQSWSSMRYCPTICSRNWGILWCISGWLVSWLRFELSASQIQVRSITRLPWFLLYQLLSFLGLK